ncbi:hypothetical protein [Afifella pfennigii]|uniref:hypothetical protein n=1 Tax=Afifella pfennigii TaxID=209897 RepID=UPI00047994E2|nr:hypothetical protein [Afifella pfennigii]
MPSASRVVAHRRIEPAGSLDFFPTPPWAARALFVHVLGTRGFRDLTVEEPACGEGHMAYALADYFGTVRASDIFPYGFGEVRDFLDAEAWSEIPEPDWIITNPPFAEKSLAFMSRALARARQGVAVFVRTTQTEGLTRYRQVYRRSRPAIVAQFVERVPLHRGRWVPDGDTLTAYCWIVWRLGQPARRTDYVWIPPGCRESLTFQRDLDDLPWSLPDEGDAE